MKKTSVTTDSASLKLPKIGKILSVPFKYHRTLKQVDHLPNGNPTEEMIRHLNRIGQEYPFCVYYRQKTNDPL